jgi:hypothetical protein
VTLEAPIKRRWPGGVKRDLNVSNLKHLRSSRGVVRFHDRATSMK